MEYKKGVSTSIIAVVVATVLILIGFFFYNSRFTETLVVENEEEQAEITEENEVTLGEDEKEGDDASVNIENTEATAESLNYTGEVLAGDQTLLLDFNNTDYQRALSEKELVVLYFYANWCPTCKAEFPEMQSAFDQLQSSDVIGFRVNFNDNQTDSFEKGLAKEFGVAYQHTKIILKNGEQVLKSPETWQKSRYLSEINSFLN